MLDTIWKACAYGDFERLREFVTNNPSLVNTPDEQGVSRIGKPIPTATTPHHPRLLPCTMGRPQQSRCGHYISHRARLQRQWGRFHWANRVALGSGPRLPQRCRDLAPSWGGPQCQGLQVLINNTLMLSSMACLSPV